MNLFQFLIGTLKTRLTMLILKHFEEKFQFLIGTLKTLPPGKGKTVIAMFQFLIGTLKTGSSALAENCKEYMFQFLIGTLKTSALGLPYLTRTDVSIPYRYAKNGSSQRFNISFID